MIEYQSTGFTDAQQVQHIQRTAIHDAVLLPLALLQPNAYNRKRYDPVKLAELVASVGKHGVIQPIIARHIDGAVAGQPLYEIVAGERRWRAANECGLPEIPALVRHMTDLELMELLLVENKEREDMNALDEASVLQAMLRKPDGLLGYATVDELAARVGRSRAYVFQRLKLLTLCETARDALLAGELDASHALIIARIPAAADQAEATKHITRGFGGNRMSVRDAQEYVHRTFMLDLDKAIFKITDADLVPGAGSCRDCNKRTGANPDLFADVKKGDTCTDAACYHGKEDAHNAAIKATAQAEGKTVISGAEAKKAKPQNYGSLKGLLKLDETHYQLGDKPLRKLLGKGHTLEVLVFEDPHTKLLYDVVREADALALLKERGVIQRAAMPGSSATQRDEERKAKAETAWRKEVARIAVENAGGDIGTRPEVRQELLIGFALLMWLRLENEHSKHVERLMAWQPIPGSGYDTEHQKQMEARIRGLDAGGFAQFLTACQVSRQMVASVYGSGQKPEKLLAVAELLGVDVKGVQKQLRDEALMRVKAQAKPAAKGTKPKRAANPVLTPEQALAASVATDEPRGPSGKRLRPGGNRKVPTPKKPVKYFNPATGDTWTGRGLKPKWLTVALANGGKLDDYLTETQASNAKPAKPAVHLAPAALDPQRGAPL